MKIALFIGAILSCAIGIVLFAVDAVATADEWHYISRDPRNLYALSLLLLFLFLAISPLMMLVTWRKRELTRFRFALICVTELIVLLFFVGMLFPAL
jgi:hypothetical protein